MRAELKVLRVFLRDSVRRIRLDFFDVRNDTLRFEGLPSKERKCEKKCCTRRGYDFLERVQKMPTIFFRQNWQSALETIDSHTSSGRSVLFQQVAGRSRERNCTLDRLDRERLDDYISSRLLIMPRTRSFPWRGAHENIDKRRSDRGELVKGEEDIL